MNDLILHLERLLPEHDCIVVPGLGGFMQNETTSCIKAEKDIFIPRGKEIVFNERLTFNDGLLSQSYQADYNITFEEANARIRSEVGEIFQKLDKGITVKLGRIGNIFKNEEGKLQFSPDNRNLFFPESYGLAAFSYPSLTKREKLKQAKARERSRKGNDEIIHIRVRKRAFQNFIAAIAACILMLLISRPAGYLDPKSYQEAFLLKNCIEVSHDRMKIIDDTIANAPTASYDSHQYASVKNTFKSGSKPSVEKKDFHKDNIASKTGRSYYIVISSFPGRASAEKWLSANRKGILCKARIVEGKGHARIYIRRFSVKSEAESYLDNFKVSHPSYNDAWLLSSKN